MRFTPPRNRCEITGKLMFKHYQDAASAVGRVPKDKRDQATVPRSYYRCEHCLRWHVTSYSPAQTARITHAARRRKTKEATKP